MTQRTKDRLFGLLDRVIAEPHLGPEMTFVIDREFGREAAVLVIDLAGFTRATEVSGPVAALLDVRRLQITAKDCVEACGGQIVKADADNVLAIFDEPKAAQTAAETVLSLARASAGIGVGRILFCADDPPGAREVYGAEVNLASKLGEDDAAEGQILTTPAAETALLHRNTP